MNTSIMRSRGMVALLALLTIGIVFAHPAFAHEGVEHEAVDTETVSQADFEKLEHMVIVLKQLVTLLNEYKTLYGSLPHTPVKVVPAHTVTAPVPPPMGTPATVDEHVAHDEHEDMTETPASKLVIELETHNGKTHVHIRYTDKPEDMFFANAPLTDEEGIINEIIARSGMTKEVIQPALKYME